MHDELLEPCPMCGRKVHNDTITLACTGRHKPDDDDSVDCPYFLDVGDATRETQSLRVVRLANAHNVLARRAEIGRLVESMALNGCAVRLSEAIDLHGPHQFTAEFHADGKYRAEGPTLLKALRALAREVGL